MEMTMTNLIKATVLSAALLMAATTGFGAAQAQSTSVCLPHADAVNKLKASYDEHKIGLGLGQRGASIVELFVSETGTWTVLVTRTNGMSCIAASGDNWSSSPMLAGDPT
jgi:hypothetical protein